MPIIILLRHSRGWQRNVVTLALAFFATNEFLKIIDALTDEVNEPFYAAIRHTLYLAALPLLVYLYSKEQSERVFNMLAGLENSVMERTPELEIAKGELEALSVTDGLPGLGNRRLLVTKLSKEWRRSLREKSSIAFLLIDLDHFKSINGDHGHHTGDKCLQPVATTLQEFQRIEGDLAVRYGGEEFSLLLPTSRLNDAFAIAEEFRKRVADLRIPFGEADIRLNCSIGVSACIPGIELDEDQLVRAADTALHGAKGSGRNLVCVAPSLNEEAKDAA